MSPAVQVSVEDASGQVMTSASGNVTVTLGSNPGGATLSGDTTEGVSGGVATFQYLILNRKGTGYTLVARSGSLASVTSAPFDVHTPPPVAWVLASDNSNGGGFIDVVDLTTDSVVRTIGLSTQPIEMKFTPDGTTAYVDAGRELLVYDVATGTLDGTIARGQDFVWDFAFMPDSKTAYVMDRNQDSIAVIDVASGTTTAEIAAPCPAASGVTPDGKTAYVTDGGYPYVTVPGNGTNVFPYESFVGAPYSVAVIDVATGSVRKTIAIDTISGSFHPVAVEPKTGRAWISGPAGGTGPAGALVVDPSGAVVDTLHDFALDQPLVPTPGRRGFLGSILGERRRPCGRRGHRDGDGGPDDHHPR